MELHLAIKNILKYQGEGFLLDPKMLNALADYNAFEVCPALKNVFKILQRDNYIHSLFNLRETTISYPQIEYEIVSKYSFDKNIVHYLLDCINWGLGRCSGVPILNQPNLDDSGDNIDNSTANKFSNYSAQMQPSGYDIVCNEQLEEHLRFLGIEIYGDCKGFINKLYKVSDFRWLDRGLKKIHDGVKRLTGTFAGIPDCVIEIHFDQSFHYGGLRYGERIFKIVVKLPTVSSYQELTNCFDTLTKVYIKKYGQPNQVCLGATRFKLYEGEIELYTEKRNIIISYLDNMTHASDIQSLSKRTQSSQLENTSIHKMDIDSI